jgi:hypothetical protein
MSSPGALRGPVLGRHITTTPKPGIVGSASTNPSTNTVFSSRHSHHHAGSLSRNQKSHQVRHPSTQAPPASLVHRHNNSINSAMPDTGCQNTSRGSHRSGSGARHPSRRPPAQRLASKYNERVRDVAFCHPGSYRRAHERSRPAVRAPEPLGCF